MKKLIVLCIIFTLLLSLVLTACNGNNNENSTDSSQEESVETTSNDVTSKEPEDDSESSNSSPVSNNDISDAVMSESEVSFESNDYNNKNISDSLKHADKSQDYCICDYECYDFAEYYDWDLQELSLLGEIRGFDVVQQYTETYYKYLTPEERDWLPDVYNCIKHFSITKEDFLTVYTKKLDIYNASGNGPNGLLTEKQLELLFGDYDENTVKKELKNKTTFYFEGALYTVYDLTLSYGSTFFNPEANWVNDETFKKMLKDDSFRLYLYEIDKLLYAHDALLHEKLFSRVETLKAEMENE